MHVVLRGSAQCYSEAAAAACLAAHESGAVCSSLPCHARPMEAQMLLCKCTHPERHRNALS